jgi:hypothetical protein
MFLVGKFFLVTGFADDLARLWAKTFVATEKIFIFATNFP